MFAFWTHVTDGLTRSRVLDYVTGYNLYVETVGIDVDLTKEDNGLVLQINSGELLALHFFSFLSEPVVEKSSEIKLFDENR